MKDRPSERMVERREHLLPEEAAAGSDAPHEQAEAILEDSQERTMHPYRTRRASTQTPGDGRRADR